MASGTSSRPRRTDRTAPALPDARSLEGALRALAHGRRVAPLLYVEVTGMPAGGRTGTRPSPAAAIEEALLAAVGSLLRRDDVVVSGPHARWYAALLLGRAVAASARSAVSDADLGIVAARLRAALRAAVDARLRRSTGEASATFGVRVGWTIIEPRDGDRPLAELRHALRGAAVVARIEERRGTVLAAITHELRTPLTSIVGFAERLLDESAGGARRKRALGIIAEEARRLSRLVDGLIDAGAWQAGSLALRRRTVELAPVAGRAKTLVAEAARERGVRMSVRGAASAFADPERMLQVLVNVVDNAVRHAKPGGRVEVELETDRTGTAIVVADDGSGFDASLAGSIGTPFAKGANGKVGLGLAIASMLVAAHGGSIGIGKRRGGGACVTIRLPERHRDGGRAGANRRLR